VILNCPKDQIISTIKQAATFLLKVIGGLPFALTMQLSSNGSILINSSVTPNSI